MRTFLVFSIMVLGARYSGEYGHPIDDSFMSWSIAIGLTTGMMLAIVQDIKELIKK